MRLNRPVIVRPRGLRVNKCTMQCTIHCTTSTHRCKYYNITPIHVRTVNRLPPPCAVVCRRRSARGQNSILILNFTFVDDFRLIKNKCLLRLPLATTLRYSSTVHVWVKRRVLSSRALCECEYTYIIYYIPLTAAPFTRNLSNYTIYNYNLKYVGSALTFY